METLRKNLTWKRALWVLLQLVLMGFWYVQISRFELYSREGYRYNKFDGLYLICAGLAVFGIGNGLLRERVEKHPAAVTLAGIFYALASVMANYPVFEPFTGGNLARFLGSLAGGFVVGRQIVLLALDRLPFGEGNRQGRNHPVRFFLVSFTSIAAIYLLYFFCVAYPGLFTRDSFSAIGQCITGKYDNTSPFWHTMLVKLCLEVGHLFGGSGNSAVQVYGIFQCLLMAAAFGYALVTLYQAGVPKWVLGLVYGCYTLVFYHIAYSAALWKDIPFSIGALVVVTALYRILMDIGKSTLLNYVVFALGGLFFSLMRTNGWYSYLVMALVLVPVIRRYGKVLPAILCAVLAVGWICNNPVLDTLKVSETNMVEAMAIPFQQVARVVVDGEEIPEEDLEMIGTIFQLDRLEELYDPLTVDPVKFEAFRHENREYLLDHLGDYGRLWLRLGIRHPWTYAKAWIDETQGYWNAGYHFWIYPSTIDEDGLGAPYGITRPELGGGVGKAFEVLFAIQQRIPLLAQPLQGIGFQVWILLLCALVTGVQKREEFLLTVPALVIVLGLWAGTPVFAEFRYAYPVFVTVPLLLSVSAYGTKK